MLFLFFYILAHVSAAPNVIHSQDEGLNLFEEFIQEHNKQYDNEEREERLKIFLDNLKEINYLNEKNTHTTFGITKFADLTDEEFTKLYTGYISEKDNLRKKLKRTDVPEASNVTVPDEFDWRSKKVVSQVKDQGNCGSCWAFSATGNVESINAIKTGKIVEISEQQLIDCDKKSDGCNGGGLDSPYDYLVEKGAMSSESYPYDENQGKCNYKSKDVVINIKNHEALVLGEEKMKQKLYSTGPLGIGLAAIPLKHYKKGVLVHCHDKRINHAVLLVGYGQEKGVPFWTIKNSWGPSWGEDGYFRIQRGVNCLTLTQAGIRTAVM